MDGDPRRETINALNRATQNPEFRRNIINYIFDERVLAERRETRSDMAKCEIDYKKYENGDDTPTQYTIMMTELEYRRQR